MHFLSCYCRSFRTNLFTPCEDVPSARHPTAGPTSGGIRESRRPSLPRTVAAGKTPRLTDADSSERNL
jgi:hypothetical protein